MSDIVGHQGESRHRSRTPRPEGSRRDGGHVEDLVEGYALGALEPAEREHVERHVRGCPTCAHLVAEASRTVGFLAFDVRLDRPSPDVKVALLARVAHARRAGAEVDLPTRRVRHLPPTFTIPASRPAVAAPPVEPPAPAFGLRRPARRIGWTPALVALPLMLALATGTWALQMRGELDDSSNRLSDLQARLANATSLDGGFGADAQTFSLQPGPAAPEAVGRIVTDAEKREALLQVALNDAQPAGSYQLLINKDGKLVLSKDVEVNDQGIGQTRFKLDEPLDEYESVQLKAKLLTGDGTDPTVENGNALQGAINTSIGSPENDPEP